MTPTIQHLFIYPIKSLQGVELDRVELSDRGLKHDRRWMLIDSSGRFLTQREDATLCFFDVIANENGFTVSAKQPLRHQESLELPFELHEGELRKVNIWSDNCEALLADQSVNEFFSDALGSPCSLVFMPQETERLVDGKYSQGRSLTAFGDGYPVLLAGTASLDDLNLKLEKGGNPRIGWNRFRPNIVVNTQQPYEEDRWKEFTIGEIKAYGVKLCSRCVFTTIDQLTGIASKEPLRTLASYRNMNGKVMFGQNVILHQSQGELHLGDAVRAIEIALPPNGVF